MRSRAVGRGAPVYSPANDSAGEHADLFLPAGEGSLQRVGGRVQIGGHTGSLKCKKIILIKQAYCIFYI